MTLDGFTLFLGNKGWQLSTRERGQSGWSVRFVTEEDAKMLLSQIGGIKRIGAGTPHTPKEERPTGRIELRPRRKRESLHD